MGRVLNKKYFGNRNIGRNGREGFTNSEPGGPEETSNKFPDGDDGIGGKQIASASVTVAGSFTVRPTVTFTTPELPGGVTAEGTITARAKTGAVGGPITIAYINGEVVSSVGGTTWTVTKEAEQSVTIASTNNGGTDNATRIVLTAPITAVKGANFLTANNITGCGLATATQYYITTGGTGTTFAISSSYQNAIDGISISNLPGTGSATNGGVGIGSIYAPVASVTVTNKGSFPAADGVLSGAANATTTTSGHGAGLTIAINAYEGKEVVITNPGSGYIQAGVDSVSGGGVTVANVVVATDSGAVGSATNQENAIIAYVYQDGEDEGPNDGRRIADIVKQTGSRRYVFITNSDGAGSGKEDETVKGYLVAHEADDNLQADITAFDSDDNEYWVTKLTAHKARLTRKISGNGQFATGKNVKWTFGNPVENVSVQIENA